MTLHQPTRILIVGAGGREHALAWKLAAEPGVNEVIVAPGSDGIATLARVRCRPVDPLDGEALVALARAEAVELVVIGPEAPLAAGVVDALVQAGVAVFGPTADAARIETSKAFCHEIADAAGVRMARATTARTAKDAYDAIETAWASGTGVVVKEDGLAGGKGVHVFGPSAHISHAFEEIGRPAEGPWVIEERLEGAEASVIALCDGERAIALPAARDHKRLLDDDQGPNTGGMGAYSPLPDFDDRAVDRIIDTVHRPILAELARRKTPFRGFLYAGLMLTADGPALLECNARLGDPEAQVILPRLAVPLAPLLLAAARGRLPATLAPRVPVFPDATVGIVMAAGEYPAGRSDGAPIHGLDEATRSGLVFHAGTRNPRGRFLTAGGRVLTVVGSGRDLAAARDRAEAAAAVISWQGMQRRHDIGAIPVGAAP